MAPRPWSQSVDAICVAVAALGLPSERAHGSEALDDESWTHTVSRVAEQRLDGLLIRAITTGALAATDEQRGQAAALHRHTMMRSLSLERLLLAVVDSLTEHGIAYRVLKGPALAHTAYAEPSLRSFCDVDVLVPAHAFDAAVATMETHGAERRYAEPRPGFDKRFSKGASFVTPDGLAIDLHRTFVVGPFGHTIDVDGLFAQGRQFVMSGRALDTLPLEETFVHVCLHTALGDWPPRLVPMRDVAQLATSGELDVDRVHHLARSWRATAPMAWSIEHVWETFALPPHPLCDWATGYSPTRRESRALDLYMNTDRNYASMALASTSVVPGVRAKLSYLSALATPKREYVADRERTYVDRWRHATRLALQRPAVHPDRRTRAFFSINANVERVLRGIKGVIDGVWLGALSRESLHRIDQHYYEQRPHYATREYNTSGFSRWESDAVKRFFPAGGHVSVVGAGGGREVIALQQLGYETVGYEPNQHLVDAGAKLLDDAGHGGALLPSARDAWPGGDRIWDAAVVGWGSYMLMQGSAARIAFLRQAHDHLRPGSPVLLSFFDRQSDSLYLRTVAAVGSALRRLRRRSPVELGDALAPNYIHYFSKQDITRELDEAGFDLAFFGSGEYGHAVGLARETSATSGGSHGE